MNLPDWAERALELFRPAPVHGSDEPDPERSNQWTEVCRRFRSRWGDLEPQKWKVPKTHLRYDVIAAGSKYSAAECVRQTILEIAVEIALDLGAGKNPKETIDAVRQLDLLNCEISEKAEQLAAKFREREALKGKFRLIDRSISDENYPDPFCIFGALELAATQEKFCNWAHVYKAEISLFLSSTKKPRANPDWADLLDQASYRESKSVTGRDLGDVAAIGSTTNKSKWSQASLQLIGRLDDSTSHGLPAGFLLRRLTYKQLANLASVAFNADPKDDERINEDQMRMLKNAHGNRKKPKDSDKKTS